MEKILIIKLGALGDVVRTLPIAEALYKKYNSEIIWITKQDAIEIFDNNPYINSVFSVPFNTNEKFSKLYNFDIEKEATELALKINSKEKYGFCSEGDFPKAFNIKGEYYLNTLFDDEIKKSNKKTYQEMMFDSAELKFEKIPPRIYLSMLEKKFGEDFILKNKINIESFEKPQKLSKLSKKNFEKEQKNEGYSKSSIDNSGNQYINSQNSLMDNSEKRILINRIIHKKIIGIHIGGGGERWPSKEWALVKIIEFIKEVKKRNHEIIVFGGPSEINKIDFIKNQLKKDNILLLTNNPNNTIREFASLLNVCDEIVTMDSFSMHIATALHKKVVSLFFCTPSNEVESYGLIKKITSPILYDFFPEKMDQFDETLINSISVQQVLDALEI